MKKMLLVCVCSCCLLSTSAGALRFGPAPTVTVETPQLVQFLPARNEALEKALEAHNLLVRLPMVRMMMEQGDKLSKTAKEIQKFSEDLLACNTHRLGRYKNAGDVLTKVREAYAKKTKDLHDEDGYYSEDSIVPRSLAERAYLWDKKRDIEQDIMKDALTNPRKWGGKLVDKRVGGVPTDMRRKMTGTGLEELAIAEEGAANATRADQDFKKILEETRNDFIKRAMNLGLVIPDFDPTKSDALTKVQKALKEFRAQKLEEAKVYVEKLNEQDAKYPEAVARRTARTQNAQHVTQKVLEQFPDAFGDVKTLGQQSPQQRQEVLIAAIEKDANATVYLTETNALEVDQKMAESKANSALVKQLEEQMGGLLPNVDTSFSRPEFDFSVCS